MADSEVHWPEPKPRRFEFRGDGSEKFWSIAREDDTTIVTFGRIGSKGTTRTKEYEDEEEASEAILKQIAQKLKEGYVEVGGLPPVAGTDWTKPESWEALRECVVVRSSTRIVPAPPPTASELDAFEAVLRFKLPPTYRAFVTVFGPGDVNGMFQIATPGGPRHHNLEDAVEKARTESTHEAEAGIFSRSEQEAGRAPITRLVVFCKWDSDRWGWDREESRPDGEYAIRNWPRSYYAAKMVAESFPEFIIDKLFGKGLGSWAGDDQPSFTPAEQEKGPKPKRKS